MRVTEASYRMAFLPDDEIRFTPTMIDGGLTALEALEIAMMTARRDMFGQAAATDLDELTAYFRGMSAERARFHGSMADDWSEL